MNANENSDVELNVREGSYVEKGKPIFTIVDHRTVWALFQVRPGEAPSVSVGDKINISAEMNGSHELESTMFCCRELLCQMHPQTRSSAAVCPGESISCIIRLKVSI